MPEVPAFDPIFAVAGMAAAAWLTRIGGYYMMGRVPLTPRVRRMLAALPGALVTSLIAPAVIQGGLTAIAALLAAVGVMLLVRSEFLAMATGVGLVAGLRAAGF